MGNPRAAFSILAVAALAGCAHAIKIAPDVTKVERTETSPARVTANAGYFIPPEVSSVEITTQGGGGDNVRYFPYRDFEGGYQKMLSNVFTGVVKLTCPWRIPILSVLARQVQACERSDRRSCSPQPCRSSLSSPT
jgi:hypothetical protein